MHDIFSKISTLQEVFLCEFSASLSKTKNTKVEIQCVLFLLSSVDISGSSRCFAALCQKRPLFLFVISLVIRVCVYASV